MYRITAFRPFNEYLTDPHKQLLRLLLLANVVIVNTEWDSTMGRTGL